VLLIDELDRTDEAFEAFLLEILSDFQVTIRSSGRQGRAPADRDHHLEPHPRDPRRAQAALPLSLARLSGRGARIGDSKGPGAGLPARLSTEIVGFVQAIRKEDLFKSPGVAETLDWASALVELDAVALDPALVSDTLGVLLKYQDDIQKMQAPRPRTCSTGFGRKRGWHDQRTRSDRGRGPKSISTASTRATRKSSRGCFTRRARSPTTMDGELKVVPRDEWLEL
jgi:hypothetical protein